MNIRLYQHEDYPVIAQWQLAHGIKEFPESLIAPPSIIVTENEEPILLLITYIAANVPMATIAWSVGNPAVAGRKMYQAMEMALDATIYILKQNHIKMIYCNLAKLSRLKMLDKFGFQKGEKTVYERFLICQA